MIWTVSDSASAFRRVYVRVCVRLVLLAPGSPAQAKLPVRSWHHLPPSQPYTEDNRALLWGSCDLSVQLVCPYFCHPVRIRLLPLSFFISLFHFLSLSFFFLSLSLVNASLWCWLWLQPVAALKHTCIRTHTNAAGSLWHTYLGADVLWYLWVLWPLAVSYITLLSLAVNWCLQHVDAQAPASTAP